MNRVLWLTGFLSVAIAVAPSAIADNPPVEQGQIEEWIGLAEVAEAERDDEVAIFWWKCVSKSLPESHEYAKRQARLHFQLEQYELAAERFTHAIKLQPDNASYHNDAGLSYCRIGNQETGLKHLKRAVVLDPLNRRYANNLATCYVDSGIDELAIATLTKAHGDISVVHFNMAYLYAARQRDGEAITHLQAAMSIKPNFDRAIQLHAQLLRRTEASNQNQPNPIP